jgi:uncharacterized C2H2 Zn-finger protein
MDNEYWEDIAMQLLEVNLNGDALNSTLIREMFAGKPRVLDQMQFGEGVTLENLDSHMYTAKPDVVEVRTAKAHELFECKPCGKHFRRRDNLRRHLGSSLHARRLRKYAETQKKEAPPPDSDESEESEKSVKEV